MNNKNENLFVTTLLGWIALTVGFVMLFSSFLIDKTSYVYNIFIGLGIALFPVGVFTLLTDYNFSKILLRNVKNTMGVATEDLKLSIDKLNKTTTFLEESQDLGLVRVHPDRSTALDVFFDHLLNYVTKISKKDIEEKTRSIVIVGSSLKGIWDNPYFADKLIEIIKVGKEVNCKFNILLTHPHYSLYREGQESREKDDIAKEILHAVSWLKANGIERENVKLYKGTPTCFLMATTDRMLINPYPYQMVAYSCFCLEVIPAKSAYSIYNSYWVNHFKKPWEGEIEKQDHRLVINALSYDYYPLNGPIPEDHSFEDGSLSPLADILVIQDTGECYLSLNISHLPSQIAYDKSESGDHNNLKLGSEFKIGLLDPVMKDWEIIGEFVLNERRRGFWHKMIAQVDLCTYLKIGVFGINDESPFQYVNDPLEYLNGRNRPLLWQDLGNKFE